MKDMLQQTNELKDRVADDLLALEIPKKELEAGNLESKLAQPDAWTNSAEAQRSIQKLSSLKSQIQPWRQLELSINDINELVLLNDETMRSEIEQLIKQASTTHTKLKKALLLKGPYDDHSAIMRISAGVGGTDAQDWAEMLERMYLRWAEKSGLKSNVVERSKGEDAGIKTSVIEMDGAYAYGKLQSEHGVHRLVRLSPFNSDNLRQTSFALVEILPKIETPDELKIDDKDLKIDVYRAGGHGGQSVNTTDSAVRVTHLPTNTVVAIQNERSQLQNKETALRLLRSKLARLQLEQHAASLSDLRAGESANWGSQIRNYVLHPYTMVKDTRTKFEDRDAQAVLDGKLDEFMSQYLQSTATS